MANGGGARREHVVLDATHSGERVDKVLAALVPGTSRATVQRWIEEGRVWLDGRNCRGRDSCRVGSRLEWQAGPPPASRAEPDASVPFAVVFEDEHLIVVDKPAGVVVHPARGHQTGTLVSGLLARGGFERVTADERDATGALRPGIVHRLDKDTSGLLVVAKNDATREGLKAQLQARQVRREYRALCLGQARSQRIETLYGRHPRSRLRFSSQVREGKPAVTHVTLLETLAQGRASLVECRLETGRTHQIRVHLAERMHTAVFADALYGGMPRAEPLLGIAHTLGRQALHAHTLGFVHPASGEPLDFVAELPADFSAALSALRAL